MSADPYHLAERGISLGVFRPAEVEAGLATGRFAGTVLSWREGESGWVALASRPEFGAARAAFVTLQPVTSPAFELSPRWFSAGFFRRWVLTWFGVLFRPAATFRPFREGGRLGRAWLWLLLAAALAAPLLFFLGQAALTAFLRAIGRTVELRTAGLNLTYLGRALFLLPLWATGLVAVLTLALHLVLRVFGGGIAGWRATFRVIAYLGGAWLLAGVASFLGDARLVAPVAFYASTRAVFLPPGRWYDALSRRWIDGGQTVLHEVPMDAVPVFFREGASIPLQPDRPSKDLPSANKPADVTKPGL